MFSSKYHFGQTLVTDQFTAWIFVRKICSSVNLQLIWDTDEAILLVFPYPAHILIWFSVVLKAQSVHPLTNYYYYYSEKKSVHETNCNDNNK